MKPVDKPSTSFSRKKSQEPSPAAFIQEDLNSKLSRMSLKLKAKMKKVDKLENNNSSKLTHISDILKADLKDIQNTPGNNNFFNE